MSIVKNPEIFRQLREAIKEAKVTQAEISTKLHVSPPFLSRLLNGRDSLSIDRAYEILKILNVSSERRLEIQDLLTAELNSFSSREKSDALRIKMLHRVEAIGHNSFLSFILDFWSDLSEAEQMEVFRFFVDVIDRKQKREAKEISNEGGQS